MKVYFLFRSARLCSSSHIGPQKSLSIGIGVEHITQCLCFAIATFSACFMYFDIGAALSIIVCLIKGVEFFELSFH